jgi:hypothetical protein
MQKASPGTNTVFYLGQLATGHLLELARLLSINKIFDYAAQNAIWCITNDNDLASIHSDNNEHTRILREFVSKATGKKLYQEVVINTKLTTEVLEKDTIIISNREGGELTLEFLNEDNEAVFSFFKDKYYKPSTRHTIRYSITYGGLPAGKYFIRLTRDNTIIYNKEILVKVIE